jgi:FAD synthetase
MKTVMIFGTFDLLHLGHIHMIEHAAALGDQLIAVLATDETIKQRKKTLIHSQEERCAMVAALRDVTTAMIGDPHDPYAVIRQIRPDVIALGYDQTMFVDHLEQMLAQEGLTTDIVRLPSFHADVYSSTQLRQKLARIA